jgi:hypothetical protein
MCLKPHVSANADSEIDGNVIYIDQRKGTGHAYKRENLFDLSNRPAPEKENLALKNSGVTFRLPLTRPADG